MHPLNTTQFTYRTFRKEKKYVTQYGWFVNSKPICVGNHA